MIVLCLSTMVLAAENLFYLVGVGIISILCAVAMGVHFFRLMKKLRRILILLLTISLIQSIFTADNRVLLSLWGVNIFTVKGVMLGINTFIRMMVILTSASIMTTSNYRETIQGLVQWKVPYLLAFMTSTAMRFIPIFSEEIKDSMTALQLRGVNIKKIPFGKKLKTYVYILTPVVLGVMKRAQDLSMAMETRAFGAYPTRVSYLRLKMKPAEYALLFSTVVLAGAYITASYLWPILIPPFTTTG